MIHTENVFTSLVRHNVDEWDRSFDFQLGQVLEVIVDLTLDLFTLRNGLCMLQLVLGLLQLIDFIGYHLLQIIETNTFNLLVECIDMSTVMGALFFR